MAVYRTNQIIQKSPASRTSTAPLLQGGKQAQATQTQGQSKTDENGEKQVAVNGYQQVVEMLQAADPSFRESLLSRIARRDPELARSLREHF